MAADASTSNLSTDDLLGLARRASDTVLSGRYASVGKALAARADEIEPAIRAHLTSAKLDEALEMVGAFWFHWEETGRIDEGRRLAAEVLGAAQSEPGRVDPGPLARAMLTAADLAFRQGDQTEAERWNLEAIRTAELAGDKRTAASAEVGMARVAFRSGDGEQIESWSQRALGRASEDPVAQRGAYHMLAWAAHTRGDLQAAVGWFDRSLEIRRSMDDPFGVAVELANLGEMAMEAGDFEAANRYLGESTSIAVRLNNLYLLPANLGSIGLLAVRSGLAAEGCELIGASRAAYATLGLHPDPSTDAALNTAVALAVERIGREDVDTALARGGGTELQTAVAGAHKLLASVGPGS